MFDEATALRLERLEREMSRRKWDSAVMTASQRVRLKQAGGGSLLDPPGTENAPEDSGASLFELFAERLERLERRDERLEWQLNRLERRLRIWTRSVCGAVALFALFGLGYGAISSLSCGTASTLLRAHVLAQADAGPAPTATKAPHSAAPRAWIRP